MHGLSSSHSLPIYDPPPGVVLTHKLTTYIDRGQPMLNNYTRYAKIGTGHHGEVFLCFRINPKFPEGDPRRFFPVAMKSVRRDTVLDKYSRLKVNRLALLNSPAPAAPAVVDKLNTTEIKIKKEIAIMKKLRHPNVVRLYEVIDDRMKEKIYMVMEYLGGGEIKWRTDQDEPALTTSQTGRILRDAILGLEYLHHQGIIHRDIKPANLLWTEDRHHVKIADFGVSHFSYAQRLAGAGEEGIKEDELDELLMDESDLTKRAGTPAFLAPELIFEHFEEKNKHFIMSSLVPKFSNKHPGKMTRPRITKAIDVWALGVTLYCLLFGKTPFLTITEGGTTEFALYKAICNKDWDVSEFMGREQLPTGGRHPKRSGKYKYAVGPIVVGLLDRFLQKDQTRRITLDEVKRHVWITKDLDGPEEWLNLTSPSQRRIEVTKTELFMAMTSVHFRWGIGGLGRGVSALFRPLKARNRDLPQPVGYGRAPGVKSDPQGGLLVGGGKSPATSGVQGVHVYTRTGQSGKSDKGKGKADQLPQLQVPKPAQGSVGGRSPVSAGSSSGGLEVSRRQGLEIGTTDRRQWSGSSQQPSPTSEHSKPRWKDILSIIYWRPTKYPTPTTSLTPLLSGLNAEDTSALQSEHARTLGPARTVSTLEGGLRQGDDMLGIYGPEGELTPNETIAAFKRASSWGLGDPVMEVADVVSVMSLGQELNDRVKLVGAGGVEVPTPPPSTIPCRAPLFVQVPMDGQHLQGMLAHTLSPGNHVHAEGPRSGSGSGSGSWSGGDVRQDDGGGGGDDGGNTRGALSMDWQDDDVYGHPGGYYGMPMGPSTQSFRHGQPSWDATSTLSLDDDDDREPEVVRRQTQWSGVLMDDDWDRNRYREEELEGGTARSYVLREDLGRHMENRAREREKQAERGDDNAIQGVRVRDEDRGSEKEEESEDEDEEREEEDENSDDEDDQIQPITIRSRGKNSGVGRS